MDAYGRRWPSGNKKPRISVGLVDFYGPSWTLIWWSWRESNPRPTTFCPSIYMLSLSLVFIASSPTGRDRGRLSP